MARDLRTIASPPVHRKDSRITTGRRPEQPLVARLGGSFGRRLDRGEKAVRLRQCHADRVTASYPAAAGAWADREVMRPGYDAAPRAMAAVVEVGVAGRVAEDARRMVAAGVVLAPLRQREDRGPQGLARLG